MTVDGIAAVPLVAPFVAGTITLALAAVTWNRREAPGALALTFVLLLASGRLIAMGGGAWTDTLEAKLDWRRLELTVGAFIPAALLIASLQLTHQSHHITRARVLLALIIPVAFVIAAWIANVSGGVLSDAALHTTSIGTTVLETSTGPLVYVFLAYVVLLSLIAFLFVGARARTMRRESRAPLLILAAAAGPPIVANVIDIVWLTPSGSPINPVPFSFLLTAVAFAVAYARYGLFEIMPIARAALADQMMDSVVVLSTTGEIVEINPAAVRLFGASREAHVGQLFTQVAPGDIAESAAILREGQSQRVNVGERHLELRSALLRDRSQASVGTMVIIRDLTAQRRAEVAKQRVFKTLTHEIRSALTLLTGYADEMSYPRATELDQGRMARLLRLVAVGVDRLVDMSTALGDWVELTEGEQGETNLNRENMTVSSLVDLAIDETMPRAQRRSQTVSRNLEDGSSVVYVDVLRLHRAITTVLMRAMKRSPDNGRIRVEGHLARGVYEISVFDDGPTVPPEDLPFIFDPFIEGDPDTTSVSEAIEVERYRLATARGFIELHGGEINYASSDGLGSGLILSLPVAIGALIESSTASPPYNPTLF